MKTLLISNLTPDNGLLSEYDMRFSLSIQTPLSEIQLPDPYDIGNLSVLRSTKSY